MITKKKRSALINKAISVALYFLLSLFSFSFVAYAEEASADSYTELNEIEQSIADVISRQAELTKTIAKEKDAVLKEELTLQAEQSKTQIQNLQNIFEKVAFGGVSTQSLRYKEEAEEAYNWQEELLQIVRPVFSEMRRLTEKPRTLDKLRMENSKINLQLETLEKGLLFLADIPKENLDANAKKRLESTRKYWLEFKEDLQRNKDINQLQLKELEGKKHSTWERIKSALYAIFLGRGLILLAAFAAFFGIVLTFNNGLNYLLSKRGKQKKNKKANTRLRILLVVYRVIVYIVAILALLSVLYAKGDMVLFGLAFLIFIMLILSFRNYAPRYMSELKVFLNLGTVREGERVVYNGIAWRVQKIGFYCILVNPALDNGVLRIPLSELPKLFSRPIKKDEVWFPTKIGDNVLFPDGEFGVVLRQTPESVYLDTFTSEVIYPAATFAALGVKNLSTGYIIAPVFGLDYIHANLPVGDVIEAFEAAIHKRLIGAGMEGMVIAVSVQFKRIVYGVSLEYALIMTISGEGAGFYYMADRLANVACLEVCQEKGWSIPKKQLAIARQGDTE